jgi:hypothetical protein
MDYKINGIGVGRDPNSIERKDSYSVNFEKIGNSKDNIKVFNNFISDDICDELLSVKGLPHKNESEFWSNRVFANRHINVIADTFREKIRLIIEKEYKVDISPIAPAQSQINPAIISWHPGIDMGLHVDDLGTEDYHMAALIYLNDNFIGGEISFPTHGIEIKPKSGDLIIFPGNLNYAHKIDPIISGNRYTMPFWFKYE